MADLVRERAEVGGRSDEGDVPVRAAVDAGEGTVDVVDVDPARGEERRPAEGAGRRAVAGGSADRVPRGRVPGDIIERRVELHADVVLVVQQVRVGDVVLRTRGGAGERDPDGDGRDEDRLQVHRVLVAGVVGPRPDVRLERHSVVVG